MKKINGKRPPRLYIVDELDEIAKMYGDKFEELWNSAKPNLKDTYIDFGEFIVFGTIDNNKNYE